MLLQFTFGSPHQLRIADWHQHFLPNHHVVGHVRSYELALAMVQAGRGVAIVPALSARVSTGIGYDVTLYDIGMEMRRVVALMPSQYLTTEPHATFVAALRSVGAATPLPPVEPTPIFLRADLPTAAVAHRTCVFQHCVVSEFLKHHQNIRQYLIARGVNCVASCSAIALTGRTPSTSFSTSTAISSGIISRSGARITQACRVASKRNRVPRGRRGTDDDSMIVRLRAVIGALTPIG